MIGQTLSHFRITAKLGEGGMGEVWRAEDTKLGREVAIKVLPEAFTEDPERLARFEREAKVLASLNHQNIAGIHEVGEAVAQSDPTYVSNPVGAELDSARAEASSAPTGGRAEASSAPTGGRAEASSAPTGVGGTASTIHFLVMELVEGPTLAERLEQGPIPLDEALPVALQIAEALEEAHEKGIIHRDLKPQNIKLTPDGPSGVKAKVLDFGLAKAMDPDAPSASSSPQLTHSPTMTLGATMEGVILGTAAYMSPEQAKGQAADKRADIWAFGVVLKEMLTGRRLFDAPTAPETLAKVLTSTPEAAELPPTSPPALRRLLERCLEPEPRNRLRDIGDARLELQAARAEVEAGAGEVAATSGASRPGAPRWREVTAWSLAGIAMIALLASLLADREPAAAPEAIRFDVTPPEGHRIAYLEEQLLGFSPDGRSLAFVAFDPEMSTQRIFVRTRDAIDARPIPGTERGASPTFSPDGRQLAFFADRELRRIPIEGGRAVKVVDAPNPRGVAWASDGSFVFSPEYAAGLWRIPPGSSVPELVIEPDMERKERTFRWPDVSPDGRTALYTIGFNDSPNDYGDAKIAAVNLESGESKVLIEGASMARFVLSDRILYGSPGGLFSVSFDAEKLEVLGEAEPIVAGVGSDPSSGIFYFAVASNGDLAYVPGRFSSTRSHLVVVDRDGGEILPETPGYMVAAPRFSPDGRQIAFVQRIEATTAGNIWTYSLDDGALNRVSFGDSGHGAPSYSPDGRWIAFQQGGTGMQRMPSDGSGAAELMTPVEDAGHVFIAGSSTPDGEVFALTQVGATIDVHLLKPGGELELFERNASSPAISPDGRWIAFASPGSGDSSVVVRPLEGQGRWQVSPSQGGYPRWAAGGRELYYIDIGPPSRPLMKLAVEPGETFRAGPPQLALDEISNRFLTVTAPDNNWDISPDGDRFVFVALDRDESVRNRIEVVLNWASTLSD